MQTERDGYISHHGYRTYYKVIGEQTDKNKLPLLVLHGGPGGAHNYLLDLQLLAKTGRQIIFYDQLGCGLSDPLEDETLWSVEFFMSELEAVRNELGLTNCHLLGHSWGGMLAIDYLLTQPKGIRSAVLASAMISMPLYNQEMKQLRAKLPLKVRQTMNKHEKAGTVDDPEYLEAYQVYRDEHLYRQGDLPTHLKVAEGAKGTALYRSMWGLSEAYAYGTLQHWDRIDRLKEITTPLLITSGAYDELTPEQAGITEREIPNSKRALFEYSAHLARIEEVGTYIETLAEFLENVER